MRDPAGTAPAQREADARARMLPRDGGSDRRTRGRVERLRVERGRRRRREGQRDGERREAECNNSGAQSDLGVNVVRALLLTIQPTSPHIRHA
ncbi:MAG TPA: hypothetical protein VGG84_15590 [Gemmatimonadaceae bacterium]